MWYISGCRKKNRKINTGKLVRVMNFLFYSCSCCPVISYHRFFPTLSRSFILLLRSNGAKISPLLPFTIHKITMIDFDSGKLRWGLVDLFEVKRCFQSFSYSCRTGVPFNYTFFLVSLFLVAGKGDITLFYAHMECPFCHSFFYGKIDIFGKRHTYLKDIDPVGVVSKRRVVGLF